jgi:YbbR domain-containing protein
MASLPLHNVGLKFLSICIAFLLWLIVAGDRTVERALRIPVVYQNLPAGLEIVGDPLETVEVRVRGSSGTLGRLAPPDTTAVIDLRNARPGRRLFHLTAAQVNVPYGVEVIQVSPATLPIEFENSAVRILQVRPSIEGRPAAGHEVLSITSEPSTVEVVGPESSLRGLDEAMTEPISVADERRPIREVVTVGVADPGVRLRKPTTATVTVQIGPGASRRTLTGVPVTISNADQNVRVRLLTSTVAVGVKGTQETVNNLSAEAVQVVVDARGLAPGDHTVEVRVLAPPGLIVESIAPSTVRLRITTP